MFQILIVEDDKELSQLFQKVLEKNGYQVKSASDGAQALEDGTYHDPYHVKPIELTKNRQRNVFLVQHLLGWARYLF